MTDIESWRLPHMEDRPNDMAAYGEPVCEDESGPFYRIGRVESVVITVMICAAAAPWLALLLWAVL